MSIAFEGQDGFDQQAGEKLIAQAKELRPLLVRNAPLNEELGYLTDEVVESLAEIEIWKMAAPRRWGGLALSVNAMTRVAAELSKGCPSTGWVAGLMNSALWIATVLPDHIQEELFSNGIPRMCNVGKPGGASRTDGGYVINGRWDYASGSHHSEWAQLMVVPDDAPIPGFAIVPMSDVQIENTWNVAGLRGTGSDTIVATDVFVPESRVHIMTEPLGVRHPDDRYQGEPSDYWSPLPLLKSKALGVLVGTAEGLVESVTEVKERPIQFTSFERRADSSVFQSAIGEATAKVAVARMIMEQTTTSIDDAALSQRPMSEPERAANRGQTAVAADLVLDVTNPLMNAAGASSLNNTSPIQRYWRDLNMAARHALLIPEMGYEILGRYTLGVEPNISPPEMY